MGRKFAYLNRSFELKEDGLRNEDLASLSAKVSDFGLEQLDLFSRAAASDFKETIDNRIQINFVLVRHFVLLTCRGDGAAVTWPRVETRNGSRAGAIAGQVGGGRVQRYDALLNAAEFELS